MDICIFRGYENFCGYLGMSHVNWTIFVSYLCFMVLFKVNVQNMISFWIFQKHLYFWQARHA